MNKSMLLILTTLAGILAVSAGYAELQVVQATGVTYVPGYKIPNGELPIEPSAPTPALPFDLAAILTLSESYENKCRAPEAGDTPPFPGALLKLNTLFVPLKGRAPWLPPDPGSAGRATIEGIDSDGDCVRDDIEYYIASKYPSREQQKLRGHLFRLAKYLGLFLRPDLTPGAAAYYSANMFIATECANRELNMVPTATKELDMIFAKFHNTLDRSYRYIENSGRLGGTSSRIPDDINCDFPSIPIINE